MRSRVGNTMKKIWSTAILGLFAVNVVARGEIVNVSWTGGNGSWQDATRWNPMMVPNNGSNSYSATVNAVDATISVRSNVTVTSLSIGSGNTLSLDNGSLTVTGDVNNEGAIIANGRRYRAYGTYNNSATGSLSSVGSGDIVLNNINNTGLTLNVTGVTKLVLTGTLTGGTINVAPTAKFRTTYFESHFAETLQHVNGVKINGQLYIETATGVILDDGSLSGNGDVYLEAPSLEGPANLRSGTATLTIGSGMTVHGGGEFAGQTTSVGTVGQAVINNGKIVSDSLLGEPTLPRRLEVRSNSVTNNGTLAAIRDATLDITGNVIVASGGCIMSELSQTGTSGLIEITGNLNLSTISDRLELTGFSSTPVPILTFTGTRSGAFNLTTPGYSVVYESHRILVMSFPEPGLSCTFFLSFLLFRRRR